MVELDGDDVYISRYELATVFPNPRVLDVFEKTLQIAQATPSAVNDAQDAADQATVDAGAAQTTANSAQAGVLLLNAAPFVTFATSATLSNERVVTAGGGVTFDTATAGQIKVVVDALAILNALASIAFTKPVDVQAALQCDSLRIDATPAVSATAASHALPINLNGTTYYLKLSATP